MDEILFAPFSLCGSAALRENLRSQSGKSDAARTDATQDVRLISPTPSSIRQSYAGRCQVAATPSYSNSACPIAASIVP